MKFTPTARSAGLIGRDLQNILSLLEDCERASSLSEFRSVTLEGMARYLGYRNTGFFVGATLPLCFDDLSTLVNGPVARLAPQFFEHYRHADIFAEPTGIQLLDKRRVATLDQLPRPARPQVRDYVDNFLLRNGIRAEMALHIRGSGSMTALISAVDSESGAFDARDLAIGEILGRHLGNLLRWHTGEPVYTSPVATILSARQAEVVALLACGLTNTEIAKTLNITLDTVKKHITRALQLTGCRNRTELTLEWRSQPTSAADCALPSPDPVHSRSS
ncbi:LuxR C-terminal-related transcriptional regulator [Nocardia sp. NPDC050793]|uniref:helix-turn-helix transcriptional regulator n=1 Tax=Nocardia sp. NPDC050793 TaxID=3155159 RepID=UPI0033D5F557